MSMERRRYLKKVSLEQALSLWLEHPASLRRAEAETLPTAQALGRVSAAPVFARRSVPHFHCSAVDGIAVRAADTFDARETKPCRLSPDAYTVVDTGDPIPDGCDAVVMIEDVRFLEDLPTAVELYSAAAPWQHVRLAGEDLVATEMVLTRGHRLRPADVAALLSCGVTEVALRCRPGVAILPTGDELVDATADPGQLSLPGRIAETNSHLIAGMVTEWGGEARRGRIVPDDPEAVRAAIREAAQTADIVAVNAGSSAGRDDYVPALIEEMGELLAHGVEIMPGKPMAIGVVAGRPVLGVPGYPVSAYVVCEQFLRPLLYRMLGLSVPEPETASAVVGRRTPSRIGQEEFLRVKAGRVGDRRVVVPIGRGASLLTSVVRADGVMRLPAASEGVDAGAAVTFEPLRPLSEIDRSLLVIGSHDITLDLLADLLREERSAWTLSSAHVGSMAGLTALRRGECHVTGTHLLDEETGEYNRPFIAKLFPPGEVALVHLAKRTQGLLLPPGNPLGIRDLSDLMEPGRARCSERPRFVNRQRGSGTRMLLDHLLRGMRRSPQEADAPTPLPINGYDRELYTHLAVAAAVKSGGADVGLGIQAAARALELDFVPVAEEQYDLAIRADAMKLPAVRALLAVIASERFRAAALALGGYDPSASGTILMEPRP
jgi:putative molybdopterin biosynthesis protein